ncbi:MAG: hypothetical protein JWM31_1159 [Solirubrobacterales bacterium]|nr:hypothetical protein [Solirubrobacterales bacterium]
MLHLRRGAGRYRRAVTASRPFRVGLPQTLAKLLSGWSPESKVPELPGLPGKWVTVKGGSLPTSIVARVDRAPDGRFVVTGLLIGVRERKEITWETLRAIKPASVLAHIFKDFDPNNPAGSAPEVDDIFDAEREHRVAAFDLWASASRETPEVAASRQAGPSAASDLQVFADIYLRNLASRPHGAMTATAKELHISRATAIRRAESCRAAGLLPPKGKDR